MSQYKVLFVDDEEEVCQVIMKKLDWESMGFSVAGYARNGVEALEMAEELEPDVVMTDIKMPYMDGLTLARELKKLYQNIRIIIFSGFDEFEYAREAIKIEAEEYILKPINATELRSVFEKVRTSLDQELDEQRNMEKLREYYLQSLPVLQESIYTSLIEGRIPESQIRKYIQDYQLDLIGPFYVVTVLHISRNSAKNDAQADPVLQAVSVKRYVEEHFEDKWNCHVVTYLGDIVLIGQMSDVKQMTVFTDAMDRFCRAVRRLLDLRLTAGIGHVCSNPAQLSLSYESAKNAAAYRVLYGNAKAINIAEIDPLEHIQEQWEQEYIQNIFHQIKLGAAEPLAEAVDAFCEQLSRTRMSMQNYRVLLMELITEIFRFGNSYKVNMEDVFGHEDVYSQAMQLESTEALGAWIREAGLKMQRQIRNERQDSTKYLVSRAMEYVREHYAQQELGVEEICSQLGVSASYFSTIFKKETGRTFVNYLTAYRMEQALELLIGSGEKTFVIAEKVGYSDPNYFSYVFKKTYGMSPSKYKAQKLGEA